MEKRTKGAWIVHHSKKLSSVTNADNEFSDINFSGKCGLMLSALSSSEEISIAMPKVKALAVGAGINQKTELPVILNELEKQGLISQGSSGVGILGLTTSTVLEYTATIFDESNPPEKEKAAIEIAELSSDLPIQEHIAREYISDKYKLTTSYAADLLNISECIGFFDAEKTSDTSKLLFNGNLFRKENAKKIHGVLSSLGEAEERATREINQMLTQNGCLPLDKVLKVTGDPLFKKLHSIGMFDVNEIGNEKGTYRFVTRPAAFSKFTNSVADDAFDLAKAFVTSLTYGMTLSSASRGKISMIHALMSKLIAGNWIGPATAIGQDYQVLEARGVVQVKPDRNGMYKMKLLKKEVGQLALQVILEGDASTEALASLPSVSATTYNSPEFTRTIERKNQTPVLKSSVASLLNQLRTGGV